jgi:anthranilate/para-aminobenzoate synthase component II
VLIDHDDRFTNNLYQYFYELSANVEGERNGQIGREDIDQIAPGRIVISPGSCTSRNAGVSVETVRHGAGTVRLRIACSSYGAYFKTHR